MNCPICNTVLPDGAQFCAHCGTNLANIQPPQPTAPQTESVQQPSPYAEPSQNTAFPAAEAQYTAPVATAAKSFPILPIAIGVVAVAGVAAAIIGIVNAQKKTPIASLFFAGQNLTEDAQRVENATFTIKADDEAMTGAVSIDYDSRVLDVYFDEGEMTYAVHYDNGKGWMYYSSEYWGEEVEELPSYTAEEFDSIFDSVEDATGKETDWEQLIKDADYADDVNEIIYLDQLNDTMKSLEKRFSSSKTRKELEEALQIEQDGNTYTLPLNSSNLADAIVVVRDIMKEECGDLFRRNYLDDALDEIDEATEELKEENYRFGKFIWEVKNDRFQSLSLDFDGADFDTDLSIRFDIDFDYSGKNLSSITGNITVDDGWGPETATFLISDINSTKIVIPQDVIDYAEANK